MVAIWSPEAKIVAERRLWLAVLRAQAELGVDVPDGVHRRLRAGARAGRPGLDRRARAGHPPRREGAHRGVQRARRPRARAQGHDQPRPHRERRAAADPPVAGTRPRPRCRGGGPAGRARGRLPRPGDGRAQPQRRRAGHHAGQAVRLGRRGDADRADPAPRADRPLPAARHQGADGHRAGHARPVRRRHRRGWPSWNAGSPNSSASQRCSPASARSIRARWTTTWSRRWCSSARARRRSRTPSG